MHLQRDSAVGVRFLAAVKEGRGLKRSARAAGVGKETGYRWLRESFLLLREQGLRVEAAGHADTHSTDAYLHADMTIKQAALDRTRPPDVKPGTYRPEPDILAWLTALCYADDWTPKDVLAPPSRTTSA